MIDAPQAHAHHQNNGQAEQMRHLRQRFAIIQWHAPAARPFHQNQVGLVAHQGATHITGEALGTETALLVPGGKVRRNGGFQGDGINLVITQFH